MPTPVSVTSMRAPSSVAATVTWIRPPRAVNLIALPTRFATTWPTRTGAWPGAELRGLQRVRGQPVQALDLGGARLEELGPGIGILAGVLLEELVEGPDRRDRRPQLGGHVGQAG